MEFDKTPRFWYPCVARVAWIDFSSRTVELRSSEYRENLPHLFLSLFDFFFFSLVCFPSLFLFFFSFSPPSIEFPPSWFVLILFPFSHFLIFLPFLFSFIFFLLSFYLILIHPPNFSISGGNFPPLSSMPLVIIIFFLNFLIFLSFFIRHFTLSLM